MSSVNSDFKKQKEEGDARKSMANAKQAEIDLAESQKKVINAEVVKENIETVAIDLKDKINTLYPRLEMLLALTPDQKQLVNKEIKNLLGSLHKLKSKYE
jgi:hypothetical protein